MEKTACLAGKTALVTGGAKRLGAALAQGLAEAGANVVVHFNNSRGDAEQTAEALRAHGVSVWTLQADLSDARAAEALIDRALALAGPIDILVNSASLFDEATFQETDVTAVLENLNVNALAPMLISRRFAAQGKTGAIVNLLDTMVMDYDRKHVPYHLSKRILHTLTRITAVEFAPAIRVNAVAPGLILPPPGKDMRYLEGLIHSNPLQRHGCAGDIVEAALFLVRAEFVTGQTIFVDGGRHLRGRMYE